VRGFTQGGEDFTQRGKGGKGDLQGCHLPRLGACLHAPIDLWETRGEGNWCVETRTKARRRSNSIILRLKTSGLSPAVAGRLPRLRLSHPFTAEPLPRTRLCLPSTADPLPRVRLRDPSTADPLPRLRLCLPSTAEPLPRVRLCLPSTAEPFPRVRLCHPSTAEPLPRVRLCHSSMADPNLPLGAIFVCLGACLHAPICFWERSSSPTGLPPQHLFPFGNDPRGPAGKEIGAWRHAPRR
jgi:hypothetical protein